MQNNHQRLLLSGLKLLIIGLTLLGCADATRDDDVHVLIKVGDRTVTVNDFTLTFEMGVVTYPVQALKDKAQVTNIRLRLLNQMIDELVILSRADELGLVVSDEDLEAAVNKIKLDYPDDTFEKMLLEQSISYRKWQVGLEKRLLIEKVVETEVSATPDAYTAWITELRSKYPVFVDEVLWDRIEQQ